MSVSNQDLVNGVSWVPQPNFSATLLDQSVNAAIPASDKGLTILTADSAIDTPDVPDATGTAKWRKYIWIRTRHPSANNTKATSYIWNPNGAVDVTFQRWQPITDVAFVPTKVVDPREFGADDTGATGSTKAFRRAVFAANARATGGGPAVVKLYPGKYLIDDQLVYGTDESGYFNSPAVGSSGVQDRDYPAIPLLDNIVFTGDDGAQLLLSKPAVNSVAGTDYHNSIISGLGRKNVIVENLTLDGQVAGQGKFNNTINAFTSDARFPSPCTDTYNGFGRTGIALGNKSIARFNTIKNWGGVMLIPTLSNYAAVSAYWTQVSDAITNPSCIIIGSNGEVYGNRIQGSWATGILLQGNNSKVYNNLLEDLAHFGIKVFTPSAQTMASLMANTYAMLVHYLQSEIPIGYFNGVDINTVKAIGQAFYGTGQTAATLAALAGNYDKTANRYYCIGNSIRDNNITRFHNDAIRIDRGLATEVLNNKLHRGVPYLPLLGSCPIPSTGGFGQITQASLIGINDMGTSENTVTSGNDTFNHDNGVTPVSGSVSNRFSPIVSAGLYKPLNSDYNDPTTDQNTIQTKRIGVNGYHGATPSLSPLTTYDNTYGKNTALNLNSRSGSGSLLEAVTEYEFPEGNPVTEVVNSLHAALTFKGRVRSINPQGTAGVTPEYLQSWTGAYATQRANFRLLPLRKSADWRIDYDISIKRQGTPAFNIRQSGVILFRYSSAVDIFTHEITAVDYSDGTIQVEAFFDALFPSNSGLTGRTIVAPYRGGLAFYANLLDPTLYGKNLISPYLDSTLVFDQRLEVTEI